MGSSRVDKAMMLSPLCIGLVAASAPPSPLMVELPSEGVECYSHEDCLSSEMCEKHANSRKGVCMFQGELTDEALQQEMGVQVLTAAGLNVSSLTINAGAGKESKIVRRGPQHLHPGHRPRRQL